MLFPWSLQALFLFLAAGQNAQHQQIDVAARRFRAAGHRAEDQGQRDPIVQRGERRAVQDAIATVGLAGFESRPIGTLSGGQWQRALFARLVVQDARVVLLDEPFTAVDPRTTDELLALLQRWHAEGRTVIAVLHDLDQVRRHFPLTLLLARHRARFGRTDEVLTDAHWDEAQRLQEPFEEQAEVCEVHEPHAAHGAHP